MVRTYKKKVGARSYKNYSEETLEEILTKIASGALSIRAASQQYKISLGTLYNTFKGKHIKKPGGQTVFSKMEEQCIINAVVKCGDWEIFLSSMNVQMFIKHYLDSQGHNVAAFNDNLTGKDLQFAW